MIRCPMTAIETKSKIGDSEASKDQHEGKDLVPAVVVSIAPTLRETTSRKALTIAL